MKCFTDAVLNVMLYLEVQEGRVRMAKKDYFRSLGATASCVMRAVEYGKNFSMFNDSSYYKEYAHGDKPRLKDPPSDKKSTCSSSLSSTENEDLSQNSLENTEVPCSQEMGDNGEEKVSTKVNHAQFMTLFFMLLTHKAHRRSQTSGQRSYSLATVGLVWSRLQRK